MATLSSRRRAHHNSAQSQSPKTQSRTHDRPKPKVLTLRLHAAGFKPHPNPYKNSDDKAEQYSFKLLADGDLPEALGPTFMHDWSKVNPREQRLTGPIMNAIEETWRDNPAEFFRVNRGLVVSAESVKYDNETGAVEVVFSDSKKHGVLDGAHTLRKIVADLIPATYRRSADGDVAMDVDEESSELDRIDDVEEVVEQEEPEEVIDRFLNVEVWTGLTLDQVALLSQARNTSRTVPPYAIMNIKGEFDGLKAATAAKNRAFAENVVAFKPNEHVEGLDEFKPISVLELLQLLMAMDIGHYDANNHPIEAYKNKAFAARFYAERNSEYMKMFPLLGDLFALYDKLRQTVPTAYDQANSRPRRWNKVLAGPGQPVDSREVEPLYYLDTSGDTKVMRAPNAVFFPMLSAFRAYIRDVDGKYEWWDGKSPTDWPIGEFEEACQRLALKMAKAIKGKDQLTQVGRDHDVWATCYETLNAYLFEIGRKKGK
jgi:hypothetical protein